MGAVFSLSCIANAWDRALLTQPYPASTLTEPGAPREGIGWEDSRNPTLPPGPYSRSFPYLPSSPLVSHRAGPFILQECILSPLSATLPILL